MNGRPAASPFGRAVQRQQHIIAAGAVMAVRRRWWTIETTLTLPPRGRPGNLWARFPFVAPVRSSRDLDRHVRGPPPPLHHALLAHHPGEELVRLDPRPRRADLLPGIRLLEPPERRDPAAVAVQPVVKDGREPE